VKLEKIFVALAVIGSIVATVDVAGAKGRPDTSPNGDAGSAFEYWTPERVAAAQPRDLVIDARGLGYLRRANGSLSPYGHSVAAQAHLAAPVGRLGAVPVRSVERAPATVNASSIFGAAIGSMSPDGTTVGASATFSVTVTADKSVRSVDMYVGLVGGTKQSFSTSFVGGDTWQANLQGFSDGDWEWYVIVREKGRGRVTTTSETVQFTVSTGGGGGGGGGDITNERWTSGGDVQTAAGRILFTMSDGNYVCSGTAVTDATTGRSIILTAAHCIYDDVAKDFATNALFIPSQDDGGSDGTDSNCTNDPLGCWSVDHGVVDLNWTTRSFPHNIPWDYGYYVVSDTGAHEGSASSDALDTAAGTLQVDFTAPVVGDLTTALGYSYSDDPNFMHCQEAMSTEGSDNYWLGACDLSGGASGGPWLQPLNGGNGPVISVNSWGYTNQPGMAGPKLHGTSAALLFDMAKITDLSGGERGFVIDPTNPPTTTTTTTPTTTTTTTPTTTTTAPANISLDDVEGYKVKGRKYGDLTWSGASSQQVDIVRDGSVIGTTDNDGFATDATGQNGGGSTTWQICEVGSSTACSAEWTHTW
jgi:hypothetical protein